MRENLPNCKPKSNNLVALVTHDWRTLPIPIIWILGEAWAGWKELTRPLPVKAFQHDHYDYEMQISLFRVPRVKVSKRCSQVLRSSHQMQLSKLQSELEGLEVSRQTLQTPLDQNARLQSALRAAKSTNTDEEWIHSQEKALEGWEVREKELKVQLERVDSEKETKGAEMKKLLAIDLNAVEEWSFSLDELI